MKRLGNMVKKIKIRRSIRNRLIVGFGVIAIAVLVSFIFIRGAIEKSRRITNQNINMYTPSRNNLSELLVLINDTKFLIKNWVYIEKHSNTPDKDRLRNLHANDYPRVKDSLIYLSNSWKNEYKAELEHAFATIEDTLFPMQKNIMSQLSSFESYEDPMIMFDVMPLVEENGDVISYVEKIIWEVSNINDKISLEGVNSNVSLVRKLYIFSNLIIFIGLGLFVMAVTTAFVTTRRIILPVNKLKQIINNITTGNLVYEKVKLGEDEIGIMSDSLDNMTDSIKKIVEDIKNGADNTTSSSRIIAESARSIATGASEQAASAEEVSASIEEMTSSITQNSENSQHTQQIAKKVAENVEIINKSVNDTTKAMNNIAEKILIINDIAERIDLLAINAAIEAARAGEHGKGFAVVAGEVRNLAENSQNAANEIDIVSKGSVEIAEQSSRLLEATLPDIHNTLKLVEEITATSMEQNSGISQINEAILQLTNVTQKNATLAEELNTGSENMLEQSDKLLKSISFFKTEISEQEDGSIQEIEDQILKLQELLVNRKENKANNETKNQNSKKAKNEYENKVDKDKEFEEFR